MYRDLRTTLHLQIVEIISRKFTDKFSIFVNKKWSYHFASLVKKKSKLQQKHETMQMLRNSLWGYLALYLAVRGQSVQICAMRPFFVSKGRVCGICRTRCSRYRTAS